MAFPSANEKTTIATWAIANASGLRVYGDGFVTVNIPAYNTANATDWDEATFIVIYDFQYKNTGRLGKGGFDFINHWSTEITLDKKREVFPDPNRNDEGSSANRYVVIDNTELPIDNRFNLTYYYYTNRLGDSGGFKEP